MGGGTKTVQNPYQNNFQYYTPPPTEASSAVKDFQFDPTVMKSAAQSSFGNASRAITEGTSGYQSTGNPILDARMKQIGQTQNAAAHSGVVGDANLGAQIAKYGKTLDYARLMSPQLMNTSGYQSQSFQTPSIWSSLVSGAAQVGAGYFMCDENLKENFEPVDTAEAMRIIAAIPMEEWNYKGFDPSLRSIGPRAQQVQKHLPNAVRAMHDGRLGLDPITMMGIQWAALQEAIKVIGVLQEEVSGLRQQLTMIGATNASH